VKQVRDENECHADNNLNEAALALCMCLGICIHIWFILVVGSANVLKPSQWARHGITLSFQGFGMSIIPLGPQQEARNSPKQLSKKQNFEPVPLNQPGIVTRKMSGTPNMKMQAVGPTGMARYVRIQMEFKQ
jgi:hypothetical protein